QVDPGADVLVAEFWDPWARIRRPVPPLTIGDDVYEALLALWRLRPEASQYGDRAVDEAILKDTLVANLDVRECERILRRAVALKLLRSKRAFPFRSRFVEMTSAGTVWFLAASVLRGVDLGDESFGFLVAHRITRDQRGSYVAQE